MEDTVEQRGPGVDPRIIQEDFDRIAEVPEERWNHNLHYHQFLLKQLTPRCKRALDLGCGTGVFTRALAQRADRVLGLDLSPRMIQAAKKSSGGQTNIDFQVANALTWAWPEAQFDCIASIATLHHLPMAEMVPRLRRALKPGGVLLVLDLYRQGGPRDSASSMVAAPLSIALRAARTGRLRPAPAVRRAWAAHAPHDRYLTVPEVRRICASMLPGAQMRKHLFWRYSIVWRA
jgi:ubiquinone/menaquinone biosynthesis C-methylase UbiE